ncbi:hypothetical protein [Paenibacillus physcomitrellae]|uniref:SRPBCC family protein n=1 Tax=Paenibacillus physcomitrellae TaxID=1619311 RepID=A0ABQ1FR54_9BACL|nr:hypothetical protein [Paenibacillus physcomitrellae]GGA25634.1 hypothetical protein GCM10010917_08240 [Paenibacillus physcomitrellae]
MKFKQSTILPIPAQQINLDEWLFQMSDKDYQESAKGHRAMGTFSQKGRRGMINVESIGGHFLIQHYMEERSSASEVVMFSPETCLYLTHILPLKIGVRWTMNVTSETDGSSRFTCNVELLLPLWLRVIGTFAAMSHFVQSHTDEETLGFARDITRKFKSNFNESTSI